VRDLHGRSPQLFESLKELLTEEQAFPALAELYDDEVAHEAEPERRRSLYLELGAVHRHHTGELLRALEAFVVARDWERAIEVAGLHPADAGLGLSVVERLRELAVKAFDAEARPEALAAADWAVQELCDRRSERGEYETVVSELLDAAKLPFSATRKRELRRDAACLCSDRLDDNQSAITLFNELLAEEPGDEVARASVTRLSLLLEEQGLHAEIVALWEAQAKARHERGDGAGAALLYARAGENAEQRLADRKRAIANHEAGAKLGGEASLTALSRIFREQGELPKAADALERLLLIESSELIAERALELLAVYRELGAPERGRPALERAARLAIDAQAVRAALATLYRELSDHEALASLRFSSLIATSPAWPRRCSSKPSSSIPTTRSCVCAWRRRCSWPRAIPTPRASCVSRFSAMARASPKIARWLISSSPACSWPAVSPATRCASWTRPPKSIPRTQASCKCWGESPWNRANSTAQSGCSAR
jgi:tetratricopeptide (TPR) repeat protein